jgi:two-component system cell cycle sensor histidine kinase/response regulator CckA
MKKTAERLNSRIQSIADSTNSEYLQLALIAALVFSAIGTIVSFVVARGLARPIRQLSGAARRIGKGDYKQSIPIKRSDEIGDLADSIRNMADSLDATTVSKDYLHNIIQSIADALLVVEPGGTIKTFNPALARLLGYAPRELAGLPASQIIPDFDKLSRQGPVTGLEINYLAKNGEKHPVSLSLSVMRGPDDQKPQAIICAASSLAEIKSAYEETAYLQKELAHAQRLQAIGTLAAGVAHDFNNLLQIIYNCVEILREDPGGQDAPHYLDELERAAERAAELVRHLLTFSRKVEPSLKHINLNQEVQQVAAILRRTLPRMVEISTSLSPNQTFVKADPAQLETILMNLASNSRDAMPFGGSLSIETLPAFEDQSTKADINGHAPQDFILLRVSDTGTGIEPEVQEHIFDPFFTTKPVGKGTGLGLSAVYGIVKSHQGHIAVHSQPGQGTTFNIYLPAVEQIAATSPPAPAIDSAPGSGKVLWVDDDEAVLATGRKILTDNGYEVITAWDAEAALDILIRPDQQIDLTVLDLGMPGMGGQACLEKIMQLNPRAKVIIASGYVNDSLRNELIQSGALAVVGKPYRSSQILRQISNIFNR